MSEIDPSQLSMAQRLAALDDATQAATLDGVDLAALQWDWKFWGRPNQILPSDMSWYLAILLAGRGYGKTRAGCEWVRDMARQHPGSRGALVARTAADARDVVVEGESGILAVCPPSERPEYEPSKRRLTWPNGTVATLFTADAPDQLRGPQFDWALGDEVATWPIIPDASGLTAWDNLRIATRLGANPQIVIMTTPKRTPLMKELLALAEKDERVILRRGKTSDNVGNLAQVYLDTIYGLYEGTRLAAQELEGLMLDAIEGALWSEDMLDEWRIDGENGLYLPESGLNTVVAVDPSVSDRPKDECGIVVVSGTRERKTFQRHAYVLEDNSILGSPKKWSAAVVAAARKYNAPVVAEVNQGGALVKDAIQAIDPTIKVYTVTATKGKALRAEPVVLAYEQGRVHHNGWLPELESQLMSWVPTETKKSPDRLDALVWGVTALLVQPPKGMGGQPMRARAPRGPIPGLSSRGGMVGARGYR